jgi:cobalamin biosynthesis Mg chelatase CobN
MLNARNLELLQRKLEETLNSDTEVCDRNECPQVLNQLWVRQILNQQVASDKAYAKKHSLELAFTPKILSSKLADRSNKFGRVA